MLHRLSAFFERLGGMVVAPLTTLEREAPTRGFNDLLLLLLAQAVALQLPAIVRAGWSVIDDNVLRGALAVLQVLAQQMIVPLGAMAVAALILRAADRRGRWRPLDAAALCAVPPLALQIVFNLVGWLIKGSSASLSLVRSVVLTASVIWYALLVLLAALELWRKPSAGGSRV